jgi:hypothetical protein
MIIHMLTFLEFLWCRCTNNSPFFPIDKSIDSLSIVVSGNGILGMMCHSAHGKGETPSDLVTVEWKN